MCILHLHILKIPWRRDRLPTPLFLGFPVKNMPAVWETWIQSLGWDDSLEKAKATHSSILAWRIPWTMGLQRVRHNWVTFIFTFTIPLWNIFKINMTSLTVLQLYFNLMKTNGRIHIYGKSLWVVMIFTAVNINHCGKINQVLLWIAYKNTNPSTLTTSIRI